MPLRIILYVVLAALGYIVLPLDLIPDVPGVGWLDDLLVLGALVWFLTGYVPRHGGLRWRDPRPDPASSGPVVQGDPYEQRFRSADPYVVLGVEPSSAPEHIKRAYRTLLVQYHPDKVMHLSPEFQRLAHERVVAIQQAYARVAGD